MYESVFQDHVKKEKYRLEDSVIEVKPATLSNTGNLEDTTVPKAITFSILKIFSF